MKKHVLCLGLTPAVQRTLIFKSVETGEVNRAIEAHQSAAGKALNTAVALATLGTPAALTGFNGGAGGRFAAAYVKARGVTPCFTNMSQPTRTCTTIIDLATKKITELVEEAPPGDQAAQRRFQRRNMQLLPNAALLAISGTLPPGIADDFYVAFVQRAAALDIPVVIDSHRQALLATLPYRPLVAKLTVRELEKTLGVVCAESSAILRAASQLLELGAQYVFVTNGGQPALFIDKTTAVWFKLPRITVDNPIGSGDSTTAGFIHAWLKRRPIHEAVCLGLGCGMANAITRIPASFAVKAARQFAADIERTTAAY